VPVLWFVVVRGTLIITKCTYLRRRRKKNSHFGLQEAQSAPEFAYSEISLLAQRAQDEFQFRSLRIQQSALNLTTCNEIDLFAPTAQEKFSFLPLKISINSEFAYSEIDLFAPRRMTNSNFGLHEYNNQH